MNPKLTLTALGSGALLSVYRYDRRGAGGVSFTRWLEPRTP